MCGIVGFISNERSETILSNMLSTLSYRGPDDNGVLVEKINNNYIHLGQNRLAIQDTSEKGHQPFVSSCGGYVLVFNGEVYNFGEIREELELLGQVFVSDSDTEVILYAYKHWGIKCLDRFIGMFVFALLDINFQKLFIVRDRAGVKPLYYYQSDNIFTFASELKSFHKHPDFKKKLNKEVLSSYFQLGYIPAPHTIFQNTFKLLPGHYLEYDLSRKGRNSFKIHQYWNVEDYYKASKWNKTEDEIIQGLEALLKDSVRLRMISDVPVGVFLSGGYDSSLLTALLSEDLQDLKTFTIGFNEKEFNEAKHANKIAQHLGTSHTEKYLKADDLLRGIDDLPFYFDEPFGDSSALATMQVSELAKKQVTVGISADGGDEIFCGYSKYFALNKFNSYRKSKFKRLLLKLALKIIPVKLVSFINNSSPEKLRITNLVEKLEKLNRAIVSVDESEMFLQASSYSDPRTVAKILNNSDNLRNHFKFKKGISFLSNMMLKDYKTFMVDDVLTKVDRSTMSVSLEGREPLLDHRIIEFMARVPDELKIKDGQSKYLLRKVLYKYVPKELVDKPKAGFQIPLAKWLKSDLRNKVDEYISETKLDSSLFNVKETLRVKESFYQGKNEKASLIWFILMFQMWREKWDV